MVYHYDPNEVSEEGDKEDNKVQQLVPTEPRDNLVCSHLADRQHRTADIRGPRQV